MIDGCESLLSEVITNIIDKSSISYAIGVWEIIFYCSDLLWSEEDSSGIKEKIECMLRKSSTIIHVEFGYLNIKSDQIVSLLAEELEFEFIANLYERVHPVHFGSYKIIKTIKNQSKHRLPCKLFQHNYFVQFAFPHSF